jgi:hypothetical protein
LNHFAPELNADSHCADATDGVAVEQCLESVSTKHGSFAGVVNCVGSLLLKPAHLTTDADWSGVIAANLTSSFHILRAAANRLMKSGGGSLVFLTSAVAQRGMINHEAIAAAKAGVVGLALSAAATYARTNIMASKPYVASGKYLHRMSNYCAGCRYDPAQATGARACPFTTLYWDFLWRHETALSRNQRMTLQLKNLARWSPAERTAIQKHAAAIATTCAAGNTS